MKLATLALAPLFLAAAASVPTGTVDKQGVARFTYDYGRPPAIVCAPTITCDIELDRGEIVGDIVSGDSIKRNAQSGWIIAQGKQGVIPHIYVSPMSDHGLTNLLVTTNRRPYALYLVATSAANVKTWRYGFTYADDVAAATPAPSTSPEVVETAMPTPRYYGYNVSGNARFRPTAVYSVADRLYIELPAQALNYTAPSVAAIVNGQRLPVGSTYEVDTNRLVVFGDFQHIVLFTGDGKAEQHVTVDRR